MKYQKHLLTILFFISITSKVLSQGFSFDAPHDSTVHEYRFNLLVGVSEGITKMELGCFVNIDRKNVQYVQLAGFGNKVGGNVTGWQLAGFLNANGGEMIGIQGAGFANYNAKDTRGTQCAGFFNYTNNISGIQGAGFSNYARNVTGIQAAGFFNYAHNSHGLQAAGFADFIDSSCTGVQSAGFFNYCNSEFTGIQAAGFLNYAGTVKKGLQIAPFNIADSSNGTPIGLVSYVRKGGYHKIEISSDEVFYSNIAVRTGVRKLYNILTVGIRPVNSVNPLWTFGYGLGTAFSISQKLDMNIDITSNHINYSGYCLQEYWSNDYKIYVGADFHITDHLSIAAGPTLNFYVVHPANADFVKAFNDIPLAYLYDPIAGNLKDLKVWVGGKIAIRFF